MTCELTAEQFQRYLASALAWGEELAIVEQVESCASCSQRLVLLRLEKGITAMWPSRGPVRSTLHGAEGNVDGVAAVALPRGLPIAAGAPSAGPRRSTPSSPRGTRGR